MRALSNELLMKLGLLAMIVTMSVGLAACDNTIRGIGEDINETADAVEDETE